MSKPRWTPQEDLLLIQKYRENNNSFDSLPNFFEQRNKDSIKKHFNYLIEKSNKIGVSVDEFVQKNAIYDKITHIQNIFITEKNNFRIFVKMIKFSFDPSEIITAMLLLSQQNFFLCIKLAYNFKYLREKWSFDITDIFYKISLEIRSDLFLQVCCFLQIFTYDEMKMHIPYIYEIENFNSYPILNFRKNEEILENARSILEEKRKDAFINDVLQENKNLKKKIAQLKNELFEQSIQIENITQKLHDLKINFLSIAEKNKENYDNELQQIDFELHKNNYIISKEMASKYPLLDSMLNRLITKKPDQNLLKFSSLLKLLNRNTYDYLCNIIPLYSNTSCRNYTKPIKHVLTQMINDKNDLLKIIETFYQNDIEFENHRPKQPILVTVCGDAASLKPTFTSSSKAVYAFELLPLDSSLQPCIIHMMESQNGPSPIDVVTKFKDISDYLTDMGFIVKYRATDGDISFDCLHSEFFEEYIEKNIDSDFLSIVDSLINVNQIPISDMLHLLKVARARLVNHLIMIDVNELRCVNTHLFAEAANLGPVFSDRNSSGAMKDHYVLSLFSWRTLVDVIIQGRFDAAYYLLPYVFMVEAIRSPLLSYKTRLEFLSGSFTIFKQHYKDLNNANKSDLFRPRFRSSCIGLLFADSIFLKRIMNTIAGIAVGIYLRIENLPLQRISSHDIELFFGHMRMLSYFDHSYENSIRVAVRTILIRKYSYELNYPIEIKKRENIAGIVLTKDIYDLPDIECDCHLISQVIKELMLGHEVDIEINEHVADMINTYSSLIISSENYSIVKIPNLMSGRLPTARFNSIRYALSILPLPHQNSVFEYYLKNKDAKHRFEKVSTLKWCMKIIKTINQDKDSKLLDIPFDYDLIKKEDRSKILKYITEHQNHNEEQITNIEIDEKVIKNQKNELRKNLKETINLMITLIEEKTCTNDKHLPSLSSTVFPCRNRSEENSMKNDNDDEDSIDAEFNRAINEFEL